MQLVDRIVNRAIRALPPYWRVRARSTWQIRQGGIDPELLALKQYLPADRRRVALDIGANNGTTSLTMAKVFQHVHAFEPNADMYNDWAHVAPANITCHRIALSSESGSATLSIPVQHGVEMAGYGSLSTPIVTQIEATRTQVVETITLNQWISTQPPFNLDFIKIDVEGFELQVLEGGWKTISHHLPAMSIESEGEHRKTLVEKLTSLEYQFVEHDSSNRFGLGEQSPQNVFCLPPWLIKAKAS